MFKSRLLVILFVILAAMLLPLNEFARNNETSTKLSVVNEKSLPTLEKKVLELMDKEEEIKKLLESAKEKVKKMQAQHDDKSIELKKRMTETEKDEIALNHRKEKLVHKMDQRILATYERIKKAKKGLYSCRNILTF